MFDYVRKHTKILMFMMFLLIIPSFVLVGIDGYNRFNDRGAAVASVGGRDITQGEWDAAHKSEVERIRRRRCPRWTSKLLDSPKRATPRWSAWCATVCWLKPPTHSSCKPVMPAWPANCSRTRPSPRCVRPDGTLDMERYRQLVASQGLTPEGFEARVRRDLSVRQVDSGVIGTVVFGAAAGRCRTERVLRKARGADRAFHRHGLCGQGHPDRCRAGVPTTRPTSSSSRRPSRPTSSTWCWTWTPSRRPSPSTRQT